MAKSNLPVKADDLFQGGFVVRDVDKMVEQYRKLLGIESWDIGIFDNSVITDLFYHGMPVKGAFSFKVAFAMAGHFQVELIQPLKGELLYFDFLKEHGEGLHHFGHVRVKNLDEAVAALEKADVPTLQRGHFGGGGYAYMDTVKTLGAIVELIELPDGVPSPSRC